MKKILLSVILILSICSVPVMSNEVEDDYFDIAANYCVFGNYNSAMEYLDKILTINPNNQRAMDLKKGVTHVISGDKSSFVEGGNPLIKQAMEYKRTGDEQAELRTLVQATQGNNSYLAYYYLGNLYRLKKDYQHALDAYNSSTSARADFAPSYLSSAIVLYETGKYESVINPIDKYLTFNPNDDLAYAIKSRAEFALGNLNSAKANNDKAIEINDCPEYQFDRAKILYKQEQYSDSKELFKKLLPDIQTSKIYEYMGLCDYALKDYINALMDFDKAILLSNNDEYLESRYNEIKQLLEQSEVKSDETTQE